MKRLLLTSVFGPYGVDDEYGRKRNRMELFHNQITREQGIASLRFFHRSYGLYFIAENLQSPCTVLDFPSRDRFIAELKRQRYDAVGISFITPNYIKAKEMARLVREIQPEAEIVLGGHGAAIEGVETLIDCDYVARGEGISWWRQHLGEPEQPFKHPSLPVTEYRQIFGIPVPKQWYSSGAILVPGLGCVNGCSFCSTSHFFGKSYFCFLKTGAEAYQEICRISEEMKCLDFQIMDENFLKDTQRALELMECVQRGGKPFTFSVFSSAEAIEAFGIENMVRMGITYVWIGAESKADIYAKNQGRDIPGIIRKMRDHGIAVVVSGILFLEHHTPENIQEDIDYLIGLEGVFTQFMMLTAMPVTGLYEKYKQAGLLDFDLPYEDWHGQEKLNFRHPKFKQEDTCRILDLAFQQEFDRLSSSMYRLLETNLRGYRTLAQYKDPWMKVRREQAASRAKTMRILFPAMLKHSHNELERQRVQTLEAEYNREFGRLNPIQNFLAQGARGLADLYAWRVAHWGDTKQPKTLVTHYRK